MINIIIPVVNVEMLPFVEEAKKQSDALIIVGVIKSLKDKVKKTKKSNFIIKVYEDGSKKEEIINSLKDQIEEGKVIICRKPLSSKELFAFIESKYDVSVCKENRSKIGNFFFNLWQKVMKFLFGFEFFNGDISVVAFSKSLFPVIKNIENLSYASRIDKWKETEIGLIETSSPACKKEYDKVKTNLKFYGFLGLFLGVVASAVVYFTFIKATFLTALLFAFAILTSLIFFIIETAIFYLNLRIGQRLFKNAKTSE